MKKSLAFIVGLSVIALSHFLLIPVIALYGVHICPVLSERGFGFGCKYNSLFFAYVLVFNSLFTAGTVLIAVKIFREKGDTKILRHIPYIGMIGHLGAFASGIYFLTRFLTNLDVPTPTLDRLLRGFTYAALLLSVLQANVLDWIAVGTLRDLKGHAPHPAVGPEKRTNLTFRLNFRWTLSYFLNALPFIAVLVITGIFMSSKLAEIADLDQVTPETISMVNSEFVQVFGMLMIWLCVIYVFRFLKERQLTRGVSAHLKALSRFDGSHRSLFAASGYWEDIFDGLNHTSQLIEQRERLVKGFSSYVTSTVAEKVLKGQDEEDGGQLRDMTIITSDLRNFTSLSNKMSAKDVVKILNIYFTDMLKVMTENGAVVDKFIGDGILAYVEPENNRGAPCGATGVKVAIGMLKRLRQTNKVLKENGYPDLTLGVAVHSGPVIQGSIGAPQKRQHTIIGDPVNVTSRMEALCKKFSTALIISASVYHSLEPQERRQFRDLGLEEIRGVSEKIHLYGLNAEALADGDGDKVIQSA